MDQWIFIGILAVMIFSAIYWGSVFLPRENWQFMAVVPRQKTAHGHWTGLNLTYYGFLCATAYTFAVTIFFVLSASVHLPMTALAAVILGLLGICLPASKLVARVVEKKSGTLTVGGAVFIGALAAPWLTVLVNLTLGQYAGFQINGIILMAAVCIAYAYGEGLGRLACISFGCCYGRPLSQCSPRVQRLFSKFCLIFSGNTKKIAYASGLENQKVLPVQIITAAVYSVTALFCTGLFLNRFFVSSLLISLSVTQIWRFLSEFLRADFRGRLKITPYQIMSAATIIYTVLIIYLVRIPFSPLSGTSAPVPDLAAGLHALWRPGVILLIQIIWIIAFIHTGRSVVTGSEIAFTVVKNRI